MSTENPANISPTLNSPVPILNYSPPADLGRLFDFGENAEALPIYENVEEDEEGNEKKEEIIVPINISIEEKLEYDRLLEEYRQENPEEENDENDNTAAIQNEKTNHSAEIENSRNYNEALKALEIERERSRQLEFVLQQQENQYVNNVNVLQNQLTQTQIQQTKDYEDSLVKEEKRIRQALYYAKEEGDHKTELDLIDALTEVKSRKETLKLVKASMPVQDPAAYQPVTIPIQNAPPLTKPTPFDHWAAKNSWYHTNPELRAEADLIGTELSKTLTMNNQSEYIGSSEFYDVISDYLSDKYKVVTSGKAEKNNAKPQQRYDVAPANPNISTKGINTMADEYAKQNSKNYKKSAPLDPLHYNLMKNSYYPKPNATLQERIEMYTQAAKAPRSSDPHRSKYSFTPPE